ncbi:hypothetical protein [Roseovarius arcticus]|uniref:hypothetical protein n=1 Tax=Roseovarius arcticus TaxID=2547404 RepID=UPI0011106A4C|nr:hypothetical protein [Roseovarius arcticus]
MKRNAPRYLLICNTSDGLVAQLNGVVIQLQLARRMRLEPIIYLHERSNYFGGPNPYFDASRGPNAWDYYYEPVGPAQELSTLVAQGQVVTLTTASELSRLYMWERDSWFMNPFGYYRSVRNTADGDYPHEWWQMQRNHARQFLADGTVRFQKPILDQVDKFASENFTGITLGLQLRGSDKFDFGTGPNLSRKVLPEEYFPQIDQYLAHNPGCTGIFVATDQRQWLKVLEEAYPGKILSFSQWSLSDSDENNFHLSDKKAARGVEVLVDFLLLSRCAYIIKCHAAVGEMALTISPEVDYLDLNYAHQPFEANARLMRPLLAPSIRAICTIWGRLAESGMGVTKVVSVDADRIIVNPSDPRELNTKRGVGHHAVRPPVMSRSFVSDGFDWLLKVLASRCYSYTTRVKAPD